MARRQHLSLMVMLAIAALFSMSYVLKSRSGPYETPFSSATKGGSSSNADTTKGGSSDAHIPDLSSLSSDVLIGDSIAPKLGNETLKAELGRASWKLFHTMMARFPEKPSADDSLALKTYIQLFARLYPCGECAAHFRKLLSKYPPQTSGRNAAAGWACFVHNEVNARLKKELFDCNKIGDFYDCGCAEDDKKEGEDTKKGAEDKKKGTEDKKKGAEDKKKGAEDKKKGAEDKKKGAEDKEEADTKKKGAEDKEEADTKKKGADTKKKGAEGKEVSDDKEEAVEKKKDGKTIKKEAEEKSIAELKKNSLPKLR